MLTRLSKTAGNRPKLTILVWLILTILLTPFAVHQSDQLTAGGYEVAGSGSSEAQRLVHDQFPELGTEELVPILVADSNAGRGDLAAALRRTTHIVEAERPDLLLPSAVLTAAQRRIRAGARVVALPLEVGIGWDQAIDAAGRLKTALGAGSEKAGVTAYLAGRGAQADALQEASETSLKKAELIGFPVLFLLLVFIFGSFTAATLPLLLAGASLILTAAAVYGLSFGFNISVFSKNMASMIGLGVAVDYALFLLVRFREELKRKRSIAVAREVAMATSGRAVFFSGVTVALSLAAIFVVDNSALRSMAVGAIVVVLISVLATLTLLPALMTLLGSRLQNRRFVGHGAGAPGSFWRRWTLAVMNRPRISLTAAAALLLVCCTPILVMQTGDDTLRQAPADDQIREASALSAQILGPGSDGPIVVALRWQPEASVPERAAATRRIVARLNRDPAVYQVGPVRSSSDGSAQAVVVRSRFDYESDESRTLVDRIRASAPWGLGGMVSNVAVGGATAGGNDLISMVEESLPLLALAVLALAYLTLLILLRSVILPLKAILTNLLSVGAGYGAIVAIFQLGWLSGLTGIEPLGHVQAMALPLILAVVFGLSMDYEVFLLARIRERWLESGDNKVAVADAVTTTAPVITSAALLMITVFVTFVATGIPVVQQLGVGCAVAVAFDATVTRLVLVPATMQLLGSWNWWMPRQMRPQPGAVQPAEGAVRG